MTGRAAQHVGDHSLMILPLSSAPGDAVSSCKSILNGGRQIIIPQFGANLQGVGPNAHTPYVHVKHEIDQSQFSP
jgi:hypothetical protein